MSSEISLFEKFSPVTNREGWRYLNATKLRPRYFKGKRVLNVGAGTSDLETYLRDEHRIRCRVINLDLAYKSGAKFPLFLFRPVGRESIPPRAVGGDVKRLPFLDESFDIALAFNLVGMWLKGRREIVAIQELARVTRGDIYVSPIPPSFRANMFGVRQFCYEYFSKVEQIGNSITDSSLKLTKKS